MERIVAKKFFIGSQGVQQMHLSVIKPQPDSNNSSIINAESTTNNSIENNDNKRFHLNDKDTVINIDENTNGTESDTEDSSYTNLNVRNCRLFGHNLDYDATIDDRLPETVSLLTTPDGGKVYLVGTAHFSEESQNDVSMIIQAVQPHIVMVELCDARVHILQLDEQTVLREAENLNMQKILMTIQQNGLFNGIIYVLLLNMSAHMTRQLGMAPGGEFRRAFSEARKIPNCLVQLGDRPINVTVKRALASLSWWQAISLFWCLLRSKDPISKEDVERCKRRDLLERLLAEMTAEYPTLGEVFVNERDKFLAHSLQLSVRPFQSSQGIKSTRAVGVVGIGHLPGIIKHWGKVHSSDILPLMQIPPQSLSSKLLRVTIKASLVGAVIYVGYKFIPIPSVLSFHSLKSSVQGLFKVSANK
ncbi:traB domain-containing protein isoform X2 [Microplitis mediator]|uniref:traB domain-containing protein isoform X2 n=1 Tax=Microplitis mediator TaxID=375433 RepID=UPI002552B103|nr:traB domain-containing protein isoform X2 [Microplitis mediator]